MSVTDIVKNIRCELFDAAQDVEFVTKPRGWLAAMDLSLKALAFAEAGIGLNGTVPMTPGSAKLTAGAATSGSADRKVTFSFSADFTDPKTIPCAGGAEDRKGNRLRGDLGIKEWLANLEKTMKETGFKPDKVGYILEFTLVRGATGGVEISAVPAGQSLMGGSLTFGRKRTDVHTLTIAYVEKSPPPPRSKKPGNKATRAPVSTSDQIRLQNELNNLIFRQTDQVR
ncbi:MAG: hypothetical protein Q8Q62_09615 [Mesorhizobium sp.]|nr:hypothetical protein [Mesorhizobium sp.]